MDLIAVLEDLHAEKQWLDRIIAAAEVAARSPSHQFMCLLASTLGRRSPSHILRLRRPTKSRLQRLAGRLQREGI